MNPIRAWLFRLVLAGLCLPAITQAATAGSGQDCSADGFCLAITVAEDNGDPAQCGSATSLELIHGHLINYCYTVTNNTGATLSYHRLSDNVDGDIFAGLYHPIAPGESYQYNRLVAASVDAQPVAVWTASDALRSYEATVGTYDFVDISTFGTPIYPGLGGGERLQMPFPFTFYEVSSDQLCINNEGVIYFDFLPQYAEYVCVLNDNAPLPYEPQPALLVPMIVPFWDALNNDLGVIYYATVGTAPERQFIVEWAGFTQFFQTPHTGTITFEVVLDEASNTVTFQYQDVTFDDPANPGLDDGGSATVGLQYNAALNTMYSYDMPSLSSGSAILWVPNAVTYETASTQVDIDVAAPVMSVAPITITGSAAVGATDEATLTITNNGDYDLAWNLRSAPQGSRAHFPSQLRGTGAAATTLSTASEVLAEPRRRTTKSSLRGAEGGPAAYGVSAYVDDDSYYLTQFSDLSRPRDMLRIGSAFDSMLDFSRPPSGDFIGNDFSREYMFGKFNSDGLTHLFTVSIADGSITDIAPITGLRADIGRFAALRWDATTSTLYIAFEGGQPLYASESVFTELYTIDPATAATTFVGNLPPTMLISGIAIDRAGLMYGIDSRNAMLVAIDKYTAAAEAIGPLNAYTADWLQGLEFDDNTGVLYVAANNLTALYTVDTETGAATLIDTLANGDQGYPTFAFAIASPAPCVDPATIPWISFQPDSGTTTPGDISTVTVTMDATSLANGTYTANLCVRSDDPSKLLNVVPVTFVVGTGVDSIFADGFDSVP